MAQATMRMSRWSGAWLAACFAACLSVPTMAQAPAQLTSTAETYTETYAASTKASVVLIQKSKRRLRLLKGGLTLREYQISLGKEPIGHKQYEGDKRTPEGRYILDWRNEKSKFYRSLHVSYPNAQDKANARKLGRSPGGNIMLHGIPNEFHYAPWLYTGKDWTDGCISVTNTEMDEIWQMVDDGTPIVILP